MRRGSAKAIGRPLGRWYREHRRDLPWRRTDDPYAIWLSEVMLQQTQVETVLRYYARFLEHFPTVADLAAAEASEVLELWAGLGYYSRGKNLHRAATEVVARHGGLFPEGLPALRALPGIGEYTAAAVGSIAFGHRVPVIDGNVERVLCRHGAIEGDPRKGDARRLVREAAVLALGEEDPGDHNQAMMELGAVVCRPRSPRCDDCPIASSCRALELGEPHAYPVARTRRAPEVQHWIAAVVADGERVWIVPRDGDEELLPGHRGVPLVRWTGTTPPAGDALLREATGALGSWSGEPTDSAVALSPVHHAITHRRLRIHPVRFSGSLRGFEVESVDEAGAARLPALFRKVVLAALAAFPGSS